MDSADKLKKIFSHFPTVGQRTADRFVNYLIKLPSQQVNELIISIQELKNKIKLCQKCFDPFDTDGTFCPICKNPQRNQSLLCIIEKETDLTSIERTKKYNGLYFILGGAVSVMRKDDFSNLRIEPLKKRIKEENFSEIIVALNPTPEGRTTSVLVETEIKSLSQAKITHLARGLPVGGELEYADEETLESALEGRK
jgi:recombination protein RecR